MTPTTAAVQWEAIRLAVESVCAVSLVRSGRLLPAAGNEGRQALDVTGLFLPGLR